MEGLLDSQNNSNKKRIIINHSYFLCYGQIVISFYSENNTKEKKTLCEYICIFKIFNSEQFTFKLILCL